jgi:hypothetical protein
MTRVERTERRTGWLNLAGTAPLSVMDYITANAGRNPGNAIVAPDGTIWAIGHGALLEPGNERVDRSSAASRGNGRM